MTERLYADPTLDKPRTDTDEPKRVKLRNDKELPICRKSSTEMEDPVLAIPRHERPELILAKLLNDRELPKRKKSKTDIADPIRA